LLTTIKLQCIGINNMLNKNKFDSSGAALEMGQNAENCFSSCA